MVLFEGALLVKSTTTISMLFVFNSTATGVLIENRARRYLFIGISNKQFIMIYRYIVLTTVVLCTD